MPPFTPVILAPGPGIQRDNTQFAAQSCTDGQWCRFQYGRPRKIGGYSIMSNRLSGISRGLTASYSGGFTYVQSGWSGGLDQFTIDMNGNTSSTTSLTPVGFTANTNNIWTLTQIYDTTGNAVQTFAVATPALSDITNQTESTIYYGLTNGSVPFTSAGVTTAGGVVAIQPFMFIYDINGYVQWSDVNLPLVYTGGSSGSARITAQKIVKGAPIRGGAGSSPAALFWSLDSLIVANFIGSPAFFSFSTISDQSSILSQQGVVEYDGLYFWVGVDRFLMYNGTVQEVPNHQNTNYFFDNLNYAYANKVFGVAIKRYGEIWWCYPRGTATECNYAIIYNVRDNVWYDTQLPQSGRSAGYPSQVFHSPIMTGVDVYATTTGPGYGLWRHEFGADSVDINRIPFAINSYFTTDVMSLLKTANSGAAVSIDHIEPDFVQSGNMYCQLFGKTNAASPDNAGTLYTFPGTYTTPDQTVINLRDQRRLARVQFGSNVVGGNYQHGQSIMYVEPGDERFRP